MSERKEITVPAQVEKLNEVTEFVDEQLELCGCSIKVQTQIDIAIDELFTNIANYAYDTELGSATVRVEITEEPITIILTFIDNGIPYDPLAKKDPDVTLSLDEREIGGLGIYMVKKSMDDIEYQYENGQNILTIKKRM